MLNRCAVIGLLCVVVLGGCVPSGLRAHYMGKQCPETASAIVTDTVGRDYQPSPTAELLGDSYVVNNRVDMVGLKDFACSIGANLAIVESDQIGTESGVGVASTYRAPSTGSATATSTSYTRLGPVTRSVNVNTYDHGGSDVSTYSMNKPVWRHRVKFYRDPSLPGVKP